MGVVNIILYIIIYIPSIRASNETRSVTDVHSTLSIVNEGSLNLKSKKIKIKNVNVKELYLNIPSSDTAVLERFSLLSVPSGSRHPLNMNPLLTLWGV